MTAAELERRVARIHREMAVQAAREARPTVVELEPLARLKLHQHLLEEADGRESGGGLFGRVEVDRIVVEDIVCAPASVVRTGTRFFDGGGYPQMEAKVGHAFVGHYHSHPEGGGEPSELDEAAWKRWRARAGGIAFAGVIVASLGRGFTRQLVTAYVLDGLGLKQVPVSPSMVLTGAP